MSANYQVINDAGAEAPWLVMVHGMSHDHRAFSAQVVDFRSRYRIALIDLPGHGLSADVPGPFGHAELAGHVLGALERADIGRCHYWASHTGTALGLLLAAAHPARFRSLILEGAVLPGQAMPYVAAALGRAVETAQGMGIQAARRQWVDLGGWFDVIRARPRECRAAAHWQMIADFPGGPWLEPGQPAPVAPLSDDVLAALTLPVLIYNGELDLPDFADTAAYLDARLPNARREIIPEAGGFPAWEFPHRVNAMVGEFLDRA